MCGISIFVDKKNKSDISSILAAMNDKIIHRGPDDEGFLHGTNFAFGHRRLSIIDLSAAGHQPMEYQGLVITYNGEIYNYIELRDELKSKGHSFKSATDTEVILAAYKEWGVQSFAKFNGMWAFAIYDRAQQKIILCRDHYGIKPLNYTSTPDYFAVASEIKQFTVFDDFDTTLDVGVAKNFLANGLLNYSEHTFFNHVKELRGGHYLTYSLGTHQFDINRWYHLSTAAVEQMDDYSTATRKVYDLLVKSLKIRNRSDVNVGSCLSGGIDSSSMVTIIRNNRLNGPHFKTITSCYANAKYDEQRFSNEVTQQTGFEGIKVFPDLRNLLTENLWEKIIYHQDQPIPTASHFSEYNVFKTARENNLIVMLDGQGADEYFGGYGEFFQCYQWELIKKLQLAKAYKNIKEKGIGNGKGASYEVCSFYHSLFLADLKKVVKRNLKKEDLNFHWLSPALQKLYLDDERLFQFPSDIKTLSIAEIESTSIPYQLHSEDRNSMMFSVESRIPFLDQDLVEYVIGLPSRYKIDGTRSKAILRDAVTALPVSIKNRKDKMGFMAPEEPWFFENAMALKKELHEAVWNMQPLVNAEKVEKLFEEFIVRRNVYIPIFFRIISFYKWKQLFNVTF